MNISSVNNYYPAFQSNMRSVHDKNGNFLYKTTTYFFRPDLNWNEFVDLLRQKYQNVPAVNIINHCCSNGPEAYTLAMKLITELGKASSKFLPITARDINPENIDNARRGASIGIEDRDLYVIQSQTNGNLDRYFRYTTPRNPIYNLALLPRPELMKHVDFDKGNILEDIENMPSKNTVLLCRNFWPYLEENEQKTLAQKLAQKFDSSSLVAIGDIDAFVDIPELLLQNGFIRTSVDNVFTKPAYPSYRPLL